MTGVGFLAGGVILRDGTNVRGLNTAATIWATAAVGALAGMGLYMEAALGAVVIVVLNTIMEPVIRRMARISRPTRDVATLYTITLSGGREVVRPVRDVVVQTVSDSALTLQALSSKPDGDDARSVVIELAQPVKDDAPVQALAERLAALPGVTATAWSSKEI